MKTIRRKAVLAAILAVAAVCISCMTRVHAAFVFQDPFTATLGADPDTDINLEIPDRQGGTITGDWTEGTGSGGTTQPKDAFLANSVSQLDDNVLLLRSEYNTTGATINRIYATSTNLASEIAGNAYTVAGTMLLDDSQGNPLVGSGLDSLRSRLSIYDGGAVAEDQSALIVQIETVDATSWIYEVYTNGGNPNNKAGRITSGALTGFGFDTVLDISIKVDETGVQDTADITLSYDSTTINTGALNINFDSLATRQILLDNRLYILAAYTDNPGLVLDTQYDNISVWIIPEPGSLSLLLGCGGLLITRRRRR